MFTALLPRESEKQCICLPQTLAAFLLIIVIHPEQRLLSAFQQLEEFTQLIWIELHLVCEDLSGFLVWVVY